MEDRQRDGSASWHEQTAAAPVAVSGSGSVYTVTVSGILGQGTLGLNLLDDGTIRDLDGNRLASPAGAASFAAQTTYATGSEPFSVTAADVNGDGKPDLIVANVLGGTVSVLVNNASGGFAGQVYIPKGSIDAQQQHGCHVRIGVSEGGVNLGWREHFWPTGGANKAQGFRGGLFEAGPELDRRGKDFDS